MTTTIATASDLMAQAGGLDDPFDPVTGDVREEMFERAREVRAIAQEMLTAHVLRPADHPEEHEVEVVAAYALAAQLRVDRLPEAMFAHRVLLADVVRIMQRSGDVSAHYLELVNSLAGYCDSAGWVFEDGDWNRPT